MTNQKLTKEEIGEIAYGKILTIAQQSKFNNISIDLLLDFAHEYNEVAKWQWEQTKRIKVKK
jgi:hypothetical protein